MIRALLNIAGDRPEWRTKYALGVAASVLCQAAATFMFLYLLAGWVNLNPSGAVIALLGILILVAAGAWVDSKVQNLSLRIGFHALETMQRSLSRRIQAIPQSWFNAQRRRQAVHALSGVGPELVGAFGYVLTPTLTAFLLPALLVIGTTIFAAYNGGMIIAGVVAAAYLLVVAAYLISIRTSAKAESAMRAANEEVAERLVEFAGMQRTIRAYGHAQSSRSKLDSALNAERSRIIRLIFMQIPGQLLFSIALQFAVVAVTFSSVWLWRAGDITALTAVSFIVIGVRMIESLSTLSEVAEGATAARELTAEIEELMNAPLLPVAQDGTDPAELGAPAELGDSAAPAAPARVEVQSVSFAYPGHTALKDVSFTLEPGSVTAIVGPSGAGKTTLMNLLMGLEQPDQGQVLIDGVPAALGRASAVFQFPYLFDATVKDNVGAKIPDSEFRRICEQLHIADLPSRETVGDGGARLSGGQRQRVSVARALAHPAGLMVLDEATSALDYDNEKAVTAALNGTGRTMVIIAHRDSMLAGVDRIIRMEGGQVVSDTATGEKPADRI